MRWDVGGSAGGRRRARLLAPAAAWRRELPDDVRGGNLGECRVIDDAKDTGFDPHAASSIDLLSLKAEPASDPAGHRVDLGYLEFPGGRSGQERRISEVDGIKCTVYPVIAIEVRCKWVTPAPLDMSYDHSDAVDCAK